MSYIGKQPTVSSLHYTPLAADPTNPREGEIYYSNGTARTEGLWVYINSVWSQISTGAALNVLTQLTLTPQSTDPSSLVEGTLFTADGTSRAEGLWLYQSSGWVQITGNRSQEFVLKEPIACRVASTANVTLASQVENGDVINGVTLATGNVVLLKNQTVASENGVYTVNISGAPTRHPSADTAAELTNCAVFVASGTTSPETYYYQTAVLSSLSDNQTWSTTPATETFIVPEGVFNLDIEQVGGGGAGGGSFSDSNSSPFAAGGGGGAGCVPLFYTRKVTPGDSISVDVGRGGAARRYGSASSGGIGTAGGAGQNTTVTFADGFVTTLGANGGSGGIASGSQTGGAGGTGLNGTVLPGHPTFATGGAGYNESGIPGSGTVQGTIYGPAGAVTASSNRGGAGAGGRLAGADGSGPVNGNGLNAAANSGAGGAGGPTARAQTSALSGWGGSGYVRFSW